MIFRRWSNRWVVDVSEASRWLFVVECSGTVIVAYIRAIANGDAVAYLLEERSCQLRRIPDIVSSVERTFFSTLCATMSLSHNTVVSKRANELNEFERMNTIGGEGWVCTAKDLSPRFSFVNELFASSQCSILSKTIRNSCASRAEVDF